MKIIILTREKLQLFIYLLGIILCLFILFPYFSSTKYAQGKLNKKSILIDPGHGGVDGGAADHLGNLEKDINLAIALKLRNQLRQSGLNVFMTRETDTELSPFVKGRQGRHRRDLSARIEKAKTTGSLFIISIHCDWSTDRARRGMIAFYNYQDPDGKKLALILQEELNKIQTTPQKAAPGDYFIIKQPGISGVILEVGFLSNPEEAVQLQNKEYQERIVLAIANGILQYCQNLSST